jgi:hypothetical protein
MGKGTAAQLFLHTLKGALLRSTRAPARQTPIFPPLLLQEAPDPGSTFGSVVKVKAVSWLELCGRFPGVLPGRYRVAWRLRLEVGGLAG